MERATRRAATGSTLYDAIEGWNSFATQYQTIADYYRGVAIIP